MVVIALNIYLLWLPYNLKLGNGHKGPGFEFMQTTLDLS